MSLDVYLEMDIPISVPASDRILIREDGQTIEITREEWDKRFPDREPVILREEAHEDHEVYSANITHNLNTMADKAGIYQALWRPDEIEITHADLLIPILEGGLSKLRENPDYFMEFNPENGWGTYDGLVTFVENYLEACKRYPQARVRAWR